MTRGGKIKGICQEISSGLPCVWQGLNTVFTTPILSKTGKRNEMQVGAPFQFDVGCKHPRAK